MEQLRAGPPLDGQVKPAAASCRLSLRLIPVLLVAGVGAPRAWAHAADLILAKCQNDPSGEVVLTLSVDCARHPVLTDEASAWSVLREILRLETPSGPVALHTMTPGEESRAAAPDPEMPVSAEPLAAGEVARYAMLRYAWRPEPGGLRFSVKPGSPYDVIFWLCRSSGTAPTKSVPWQMLMAGDLTPPIPVARGVFPAGDAGDAADAGVSSSPVVPLAGKSRAMRAALAVAILMALSLIVIRRKV